MVRSGSKSRLIPPPSLARARSHDVVYRPAMRTRLAFIMRKSCGDLSFKPSRRSRLIPGVHAGDQITMIVAKYGDELFPNLGPLSCVVEINLCGVSLSLASRW